MVEYSTRNMAHSQILSLLQRTHTGPLAFKASFGALAWDMALAPQIGGIPAFRACDVYYFGTSTFGRALSLTLCA